MRVGFNLLASQALPGVSVEGLDLFPRHLAAFLMFVEVVFTLRADQEIGTPTNWVSTLSIALARLYSIGVVISVWLLGHWCCTVSAVLT